MCLAALIMWAVLNFRVAPPYFQFHLQPGDVVDTSLVLLSTEESGTTPVSIRIYPMVLDSLHGGPEPGPDTFAFSAKDWITLPTRTLVLEAGKIHSLPVHLQVPDTVQPGGYFALIILKPLPLKPENTQRKAGVFIIPQYGVSFWVCVGEGPSLFRVGNLKVLKQGKQVLFRVPVEVNGRFHRSFSGYLEIQDPTGQKIFEKVIPKSWVLPTLKRVLSISWEPPTAGAYRALLILHDSTGVISYQETGVRVPEWP